jgi:DNA-binding FadR family transcriptional regulator
MDDGLARAKAAIRRLYDERGELPPERTLCESLATTRHQVRRALTALREDGALPPAQAGRRPSAPVAAEGSDMLARLASPMEVVELRLIIEPGLARLAALRGSSVEIARIGQLATTRPGADRGAADLAFHCAVAQASRNSLGAELYALLRRVGKDHRVRVASLESRCPNRLRERDAEHRRVADAIARRDGDAAERAMREHLATVRRRIVERTGGAAA